MYISDTDNCLIEEDTIEKISRIVVSTILFSINAHILPCSANLLDIYDRNVRRKGKRVRKCLKRAGLIDNKNSALDLFSEHIRTISNSGNYRTALKYQHIRTGHSAHRWVGKGPNKVLKEVWINKTIVRSDLPKKPITV